MLLVNKYYKGTVSYKNPGFAMMIILTHLWCEIENLRFLSKNVKYPIAYSH